MLLLSFDSVNYFSSYLLLLLDIRRLSHEKSSPNNVTKEMAFVNMRATAEMPSLNTHSTCSPLKTLICFRIEM